MRRYRVVSTFLISLVVLVLVSAAGVCADYTITPWPYGAIVWVQTPPENAHAIIEYATKAVNDVFSFWGLPTPVPAANWAHPVQTSSQALYQSEMNRIQSPSVPITQFLRHGHSLGNGVAIPEANSDNVLILPAPTWNGRKIRPLIIGTYPDRELMGTTCDDYSFSGIYGVPPARIEILISRHQQVPPASASLIPILASESDIILTCSGDWRYVLDHELAHWLTDLVCTAAGTSLSALPQMIREGIAEYTAHSLTGEASHWKAVATVWAQSNSDLQNVPPPLYYDVGTSVVSYLVQQEGMKEFLRSLPKLTTNWDKQAVAITPGWRASLHYMLVTMGDHVLYEAESERLDLCAWMLDPVFPSAARSLLSKIDSGKGNPSDIAQFWKIISVVPPQPPQDVWEKLVRREDTFRWVQYRDGDHNGERMARARVEAALRKYHEAKDWDNYYTWFVTGLRTVIAAWGNPLNGGGQ